ncbi:hypothetical protein [Polaribacter porphyrae]|uniref:Uncharacterized protein n=1 Tax=Polaribacter porphyrae TaxID=1137780 RepID=A0A2S7WRV4_9FLAO|nr:hypothetical protein [Polaribacter porphyrae]PQJ80196.1 hypothetical protein BTO18_13885 [Polaribacter porphyrae]
MIPQNILPHYPFFDRSLSAYDLLMFGLGSFVIISILLFYYNRILKSNQLKSELQNPIYQSRDILLQSNSQSINFVIPEKTTSTWVKVFVFILIFIFTFTPFSDFL